jgi:hypothetical protein
LNKEIWKDVPNYEGLYQISNFGRVRSLIKYKGTNQRILKQSKNTQGYLFVGLWKNKKQKFITTHTLVLQTFIGKKPFQKAVCRHLDGNQYNNRWFNLKWGTVKENIADEIRHGTFINNSGSKNGRSKLLEKDVIQILNLINYGETDTEISIKYHVSRKTINNIRNKKNWKCVKNEKTY